MILVIMQGNGEQWEDYHEIVSSVVEIDEKNLTARMIRESHSQHIYKLCEEIGVIVNPFHNNIMIDSLQPKGKSPTKKQLKAYEKILKDNNLATFIKQTYKAKFLENVETTTIH